VVHYQGKLVLCSGALAKMYEEKGGQVFYHGKPYPGVYEHLFKVIAQDQSYQKSRVLAIGDGLPTDIKGAQQVGVDSLLVLSGIHHQAWTGHQVDHKVLDQLCQTYATCPRYVAPALQWEAALPEAGKVSSVL
jgi:ribonucleotide monophosphatase NagD (HAD superfamily)